MHTLKPPLNAYSESISDDSGNVSAFCGLHPLYAGKKSALDIFTGIFNMSQCNAPIMWCESYTLYPQVIMHSRVFGQLATLTILVTTMVFRGGYLCTALLVALHCIVCRITLFPPNDPNDLNDPTDLNDLAIAFCRPNGQGGGEI